ncbi:MAG TPA: response regulator [Anaerolineales bacterium]|nr:response regulator [Anaerolineales bacterium]
MTVALVIDDNKQTTEALIQMLKIWDITARPALGPSAAMAILRELTPNVVFLDINMPGVDGFEVLAYLRREPRLMNIPVIIVTSDDQPETTKRAMAGGANAVVLKPIMVDILENALKKAAIIR